MAWQRIIWSDLNTDKVRQHGFDPSDVEHIIQNWIAESVSRKSGRPCYFGYALDGRYAMVPYDVIDDISIYPRTCFEVPEPRP